jgi:uncharacterized protein (TIGR02246 family)
MSVTHPNWEERMTTDDIARSVLRRLEDAWNAGDGDAFGREYADGAGFVNIQGQVLHGPSAIGAGHTAILRTIYAGSTNRMRLFDSQQVSDDVIVATSRNTLDAPHGPLAGVHDAIVTSVLVRSGRRWQVAASQTTLVNAQAQLAGVR